MKHNPGCLFLPTGPLLTDSGQAVQAFVSCQIQPSTGEPSRRQLCAENRMQRALGRCELYPRHSPASPSPAPAAHTHWLHQHVVLAVEEVGAGVLVQGLHVLPSRSSEAIFGRAAAGVALPDLHTQDTGQSAQHCTALNSTTMHNTAQHNIAQHCTPLHSTTLSLQRLQLLCSQGPLQRNHLHS